MKQYKGKRFLNSVILFGWDNMMRQRSAILFSFKVNDINVADTCWW